MEFFDSHSHYNDEKFDEDREEIIKDTYESGITKFVCAGYNIESSLFSLELSKKYDFIYSICGISPNDIPQSEEELWKDIAKITEIVKENKSKKLVAIGEIGLDYYWNKENKELQKEAFEKQIDLANELELPIVIHSRDASVDTIEMIRTHKVNKAGIFHCCQPNQEMVRQALELGYYISFAGPITFKNSRNAPDVIKMVPLDRILIETDSPYLTPEPNRGKRNDCRNVKYVAQKIAELKNVPIEEIAKIAHDNNIVFHTDAVQAIGNVQIDVEKMKIDMLSLSSHKINGPKGVGALYIKNGIEVEKFINGGNQEKDRRAGTENVAGIVGIGKAAEIARKNMETHIRNLSKIRDYYIKKVQKEIPNIRINGSMENRLPGNANISFKGINASELIFKLDERGICVSSGSACSSGNTNPSHVLTAMNVPEVYLNSAIRTTFGDNNTFEQVDYVVKILKQIIN